MKEKPKLPSVTAIAYKRIETDPMISVLLRRSEFLDDKKKGIFNQADT